jgi:MFS family permease
VEQYDLTCASEFGLSMIGSCFFIGTFLGSFVLPRLADIIGRRPVFLVGLTLYITAVVGMIFARDVKVLYGLLVLGGISETGRYYVAYVYAVEIIPKKSQNIAGLTIFMVFAACKVMVCSYFYWSKAKDWKHLAYTALALAGYSFIGTFFFLPESPKFLEGKKKFDEASEILRRMQNWNKTN